MRRYYCQLSDSLWENVLKGFKINYVEGEIGGSCFLNSEILEVFLWKIPLEKLHWRATFESFPLIERSRTNTLHNLIYCKWLFHWLSHPSFFFFRLIIQFDCDVLIIKWKDFFLWCRCLGYFQKAKLAKCKIHILFLSIFFIFLSVSCHL